MRFKPPSSPTWPVKSHGARHARWDVSPCSAPRWSGAIKERTVEAHPRRRNKGAERSAKHQLNAAHFYGALLGAGLVGWLTGSLIVFLSALLALLVAGSHAGDLRR